MARQLQLERKTEVRVLRADRERLPAQCACHGEAAVRLVAVIEFRDDTKLGGEAWPITSSW
jgi:hypothetical protein